MAKIAAAVIGCGNIGTYAHIPNLRALPGVELVTVCDVIEERAEAASRKYKVGRYDTDYHKVISDKGIGLIAICTPPDTHLEIAGAALDAGKHVFLEKPLAANLQDAAELHKMARASRAKLMPGFCLRFHGMFTYVKHLIEEGKVGKPALMWRNAIGAAIGVLAPAQWVMQKGRSGGMLVENTMHIFDAFRWLAGEYESVYAEARTLSEGIDIEDTAMVAMRFKGGAYATITQTWAATHSWDAWGVMGMNGTVSVDGYIGGPMKVSWREESLRIVDIQEDAIVMYRKELESFVASIQGNREPQVNVTDALKAMEAAVAALRSSEERRPIQLPLVS
jgi:UDP-N-acetylglucosamine 3-dehydrogenase